MKLTITNDQGEVLLIVDLDDYDLTKPLARQALMEDIVEEVEKEGRRKDDTQGARP